MAKIVGMLAALALVTGMAFAQDNSDAATGDGNATQGIICDGGLPGSNQVRPGHAFQAFMNFEAADFDNPTDIANYPGAGYENVGDVVADNCTTPAE